jgi:aminoglycoside phosphotransferase (APT) family kinase protein
VLPNRASSAASRPRHGAREEAREEAQAVVRDLDWRFLLPTPAEGSFRHLVLLGGSTALAECAMATGVAREVSRRLPDRRVADAVVKLSGAEVDVCAAASCLEPGGALYAEIERESRLAAATAPGHVRRALARAGLTQTGLYWCTPNFAAHDVYVPLGAPGPLRWYLSNLYAGSALGRYLRSLLNALAAFGPDGCGPALRRYAVTAVAGPAPEARPSLLGHPALPSELRRSALHLLLVAQGNRRVVLLPFTRDGRHPVAALKVTRDPSRNARTENEQRVLTAVHALVNEAIGRSIPRPYGCLKWGSLVAGVESGLPGRLLTARAGGTAAVGRTVEDLRHLATWLSEFHRQTEVRRESWGDSAFRSSLADLFAEYRRAFPVTADETSLFGEVELRSGQLSSASIPVVWSHGDLHPGNIYRSADRMGVIDWADGGEGLPLLDLFKFVVEWRAHARGMWSEEAKVRNLEELFLQPSRDDALVVAAHHAIARYAAALGVDHRLIPIVLVSSWVDRAVRHQRMAESGGSATHRRIARLSAGYVRALAARPHVLFDRFGPPPQTSSRDQAFRRTSLAPLGLRSPAVTDEGSQ